MKKGLSNLSTFSRIVALFASRNCHCHNTRHDAAFGCNRCRASRTGKI